MTHSWAIWPFYFIGQALSILAAANASVHSKISGVTCFEEYFRARWIPIACRLFLASMAFVWVWNNRVLVDIDRFTQNLGSQVAIAGGLGFFSDKVLDVVLNLASRFLPGLQKEVPLVNPPKE